jgi:hypothetical protein
MAPAHESAPYGAATTTYERARKFDAPFVHLVNNVKVDKFCSHCMRRPPNGAKLLTCGSCSFARYCSKDCQCRRLKAVFPQLPLTEVLFMSRIVDKVSNRLYLKNRLRLGLGLVLKVKLKLRLRLLSLKVYAAYL